MPAKQKSRVVDKDHNFIGDREVTTQDAHLKSIGEYTTNVLALMKDIEELETKLKERKEVLFQIQSEMLPTLLLNAGTSTFTTIDGHWKLSLTTKVEGAIPKNELARKVAIQTLEKLQAGDLVKTDVVLGFDRAKRNEAVDIIKQLKQIGYEPELTETVHHMTLKGWARERLEKGLPVPAEKLGLWIGEWVDVKRAR